MSNINDLPERIRSKIIIKESGCWFWTAVKYHGYGKVWDGTRSVFAHIFVYRLLRGDVPAGLELDHLCRNRSCVNPDHLEAVTHRVNSLRGTSPAAAHAIKTHCLRGHEFTPENTIRTKLGHRRCRVCHNKRNNESYHRNKNKGED